MAQLIAGEYDVTLNGVQIHYTVRGKGPLLIAHSGGVTINDWGWHVVNHDAPFGGIGNSGMGTYHVKRHTVLKVVHQFEYNQSHPLSYCMTRSEELGQTIPPS